MFSFPIFTVRDYILIVLTAVMAFLIYEVVRLRKIVLKKEEQVRKSLVPIIFIDVDLDESALYLRSENECFAKDIQIGDVIATLDYDFKKQLILKFDPVSLLNPTQRVKLNFRAVDKEYELGPERIKKLIPRLEQAGFEIHMKYANVQNDKFEAILIKEKDKISIRKIAPIGKEII